MTSSSRMFPGLEQYASARTISKSYVQILTPCWGERTYMHVDASNSENIRAYTCSTYMHVCSTEMVTVLSRLLRVAPRPQSLTRPSSSTGKPPIPCLRLSIQSHGTSHSSSEVGSTLGCSMTGGIGGTETPQRTRDARTEAARKGESSP
jgi:hypothetical protein